MKQIFYVVCLLAALSPALAEPPSEAGNISCSDRVQFSRCTLTWNVTNSDKGYQQVQSFSSESSDWSDEGGVVTRKYGRSDAAVSGGKLYRVKSCDSPDSDSCDYSNVHWVMETPPSEDLIPDRVVDASGQGLKVSKDQPLDTQTDQYNVYRLIQVVENMQERGVTLPPMTKPRVHTPVGLTNDGTVGDQDLQYLSVYTVYERLRTQEQEGAAGK